MGIEGCLSIPGVAGEVSRAARVRVRALNRQGQQQVVTAEGLGARALQHEIDHLDGILFIDKAIKISRQES
jgi:peptide deformylase